MLTTNIAFANNNEKRKSIENETVLVKFDNFTDIFIKNSDLFKRCKIIHNVNDEEGNTLVTVEYNIEVSNEIANEILN